MATLISTILAGLLQTKVYYHDIYCLFTWRISKHCVSFDPRVVHLGSLIMCLEQVCEQGLAFGLLLLTGAFSKVLLRYIPGEVYFLASNYKKMCPLSETNYGISSLSPGRFQGHMYLHQKFMLCCSFGCYELEWRNVIKTFCAWMMNFDHCSFYRILKNFHDWIIFQRKYVL